MSQSDVVRLLVQHAQELDGPFHVPLASLGLGQVITQCLALIIFTPRCWYANRATTLLTQSWRSKPAV